MKKLVFLIIMIHCPLLVANSQVIHSSKIDSILNLVSVQSICKMDRELSGDTIVNIGGVPQILISRAWNSQGNIKAAQYIYENFQSFGLSPKYMVNNSTNINVYAVKTGFKYPNKKFIIGAHYDDLLYNSNPSPTDTMHGADDDASGVCAVLEAARLLANTPLEYTVIFVAFDEEESPVILSGSKAFADSCYFRNDTLIGMLNLDMIGWDGNNDGKFAVLSDTNSYSLHRVLFNCLQSYQINLNFFEYHEHWDEGSFQNRGYKAIALAEEARYYFNPYYHTIFDTFDKFNVSYFQKMVKAAISMLMTYAMDLHYDVYHMPLLSSTTDTTSRNAQLYVYFPVKIATGQNAPRLYYKVINGSYNFVNAVGSSGNYYNFIIPGHPAGNKIYYYFAVQDSAGTIVVTSPPGGGGINPPGTTPPPTVYSYDIFNNYNQCSVTLPKTINDFQMTYDTITVNQAMKSVNRIKVNLTIYHTNDGDLIIQLIGPNGPLTLSSWNGTGGANYINTTFDDSATTPIIQGFPPFTGSYKPQNPLSFFNNQHASGNWILRIYDTKNGNQGSLASWCVLMQLKSSVSVNELNSPVKYELSQNYPNPFNPVTRISYSIGENSKVKISVFDILGKEIKILVNEKQSAGDYEVIFNATDLPSGIYFYQLRAGKFIATKKLILLK